MEIYLAQQTAFFMESLMLGFAFGLAYDFFRITRLAIPTPSWAVFFEDVLFFLLCAAGTFFFMLREVDGRVRFFLLIGEGLGALVYFLTLSVLVMKLSKAVIKAVKAVLRFIFSRILLPIWRLAYAISALIMRPVRFLGGFIKKNAKRCKYRLKVRRKVLYNQLRSAAAKKKRGKRESHANDTSGTQEKKP